MGQIFGERAWKRPWTLLKIRLREEIVVSKPIKKIRQTALSVIKSKSINDYF